MEAHGGQISIALCTYNGEAFIEEQLDSIGRQSLLPNEIVICDDASIDCTVDIARRWALAHPEIKCRIIVNAVSKGVVENFESAFINTHGDYILFSDQDDVWHPDKIELTYKLMIEYERQYGMNTPVLVHTDLQVVDGGLKVINPSFMQNQGIHHVEGNRRQLQVLLAQNFVTGCTMMVNRPLKMKAIPFPKDIIMHDYWLALVAALTGKVGFLNKSTIDYRQHGNNSVGAQKYVSLHNLFKLFDPRTMLIAIDNKVRQVELLRGYKNGELLRGQDLVYAFLDSLSNKRLIQFWNLGIREEGFTKNVFFQFYFIWYTLFYYKR